jgi:hypothetical protein
MSQAIATPAETAEKTAIRPFKVASVPEAELVDLRRRIVATGSPIGRPSPTRARASSWQRSRTSRATGARSTTGASARRGSRPLPHFITEIDGLDIHFVHVRSKHKGALPMIVTHGWPGSIVEQMKIIDPLTNPTAHGGSASDAFDVVIPSIPGYGYSGKPTTTGWGCERIARAWDVLMKRLGYTRYVARAATGARSSSTGWACKLRKDCSPSTPTWPASFPPRSTERLSQGRPRPRVSRPMRRSPSNVCSSSIKRESPTGTSVGCGRRPWSESRTHPSAWPPTSSITTRAATRSSLASSTDSPRA